MTGQRVAQTADSFCDQVRGDVGEVAGRAAQVGADQVEGIDAVGVAVDHHPLVDQHGRAADPVVRGQARLEQRGLLVGGVGIAESHRLHAGGQRGGKERQPAQDGEEAPPRDLTAVLGQTAEADHQT